MWNRKELKQKAKTVIKNNYWTAIVVCFLIALLTGEFGTSIVGIWQSNESIDPNFIIINEKRINDIGNNTKNNTENNIGNNVENNTENESNTKYNTQNETKNSVEDNKYKEGIIPFFEEDLKQSLNITQTKVLEALEANLNSATKSQKYILKIWDAVNLFNLNRINLGILLSIGSIISLLFIIFIADPLIVAGKRYFLKARQGNNTKIGVITEIFKEGWENVAITMFLRNIYNALWYLTIIGGVIKTYEYRMIPYILAENPKIKRKEAFKLSKQMMKNNKWKTFILDMSFFGWNFLSVLTSGLVGIFYVNPYNSATIAELYVVLKNNAIKEKYEYYEALNNNL